MNPRRWLRSSVLAWTVAGVLLVAMAGVASTRPQDQSARVKSLTGELVSSKAALATARGNFATTSSQASGLSGQVESLTVQISELQSALDKVKASKIHTVVQTKIVTKTVPRWVPNGSGISVELTGFEGLIEIHDAHITHGYGYTHVIGIAINRSGQKVSYAELGCSLLSPSGADLANSISNNTDWPAGASWGFDCAEQVNATGAVLRVDSMQ